MSIMESTFDSSIILRNVLGDEKLVQSIKQSNLLLVGGGGIGCEVIKNLLLVGFRNITLIDLDTIDVSNLNRQFLFNKSHVGKSKSKIAAEVAVQRFVHPAEDVNITPLHNTIQSEEFDLDFYKSFTLVINALDNRAARSHVNRMCLSADVPLIESGSEGYFGTVFTIKKGVSACYECDGQKQDQRTFASCTIRNTPSQPIHCIVWSKHLFSQLFGEEDADNDVSPDMNDPELDAPTDNGDEDKNKIAAPSTRVWAEKNNYDTSLLFEKFFNIDIKYLLKMDKLWEKRKKPRPISIDDIESFNGCEPSSSTSSTNGNLAVGLKDQRLWSLKECFQIFTESVQVLKNQLKANSFLVWDKDDDPALNFVCAVSNLRSHCFNIERKSKFDVKSMAGNIIPAISSTNSIVGGVIVLQALNLLRRLPLADKITDQDKISNAFKESCHNVFLRKVSLNAKNLVASYELFEPNPNCLICCTGHIPEVEILCSLKETTMCDFVEQIIFKKLNFVTPDVQIDGQPIIIWSKDDSEDQTEKERESYRTKPLIDYPKVCNKTRLRVYDLLQDYTMIVNLTDESVDPNENDGLFYKFNVISEGTTKPTNNAKTDEPSAEGGLDTEDTLLEAPPNNGDKIDIAEPEKTNVNIICDNVIELDDEDDDDDEAIYVSSGSGSSANNSSSDSVIEYSSDGVEIIEKRKLGDLSDDLNDDATSKKRKM